MYEDIEDMEPMHDRLILERIEEPSVTLNQAAASERKIILTDEPPTRLFKVLKVGPGKWVDGVFERTVCRPGHIVILPGIAATYPDYETKRYILAQEGDIGAIVG